MCVRFSGRGTWCSRSSKSTATANGSAWMLARIILYDCVVSEWSRASGDYIISTVWVKYEKSRRVWNMKCGCMRASTVRCRFLLGQLAIVLVYNTRTVLKAHTYKTKFFKDTAHSLNCTTLHPKAIVLNCTKG